MGNSPRAASEPVPDELRGCVMPSSEDTELLSLQAVDFRGKGRCAVNRLMYENPGTSHFVLITEAPLFDLTRPARKMREFEKCSA